MSLSSPNKLWDTCERKAREKGLIPWRVDEARLNELRGEAAKVQPSLPENIDLRDAKHTLATEDVWYMYRGHCLDSLLYDNQISITFDDIRMIPDIVSNYDSVKPEKVAGQWPLVFLKQYGNITYRYVANISREHDAPKVRHITLKTGWLIKRAGAEGNFTSIQSQTQGVSHFPRTAIVTPMEEYIKQKLLKQPQFSVIMCFVILPFDE